MALAPTDVASIEETTAIRLVSAHRRGDPDAFAEIVRTHYPSLLATARHRLRNADDAQDAVQETLLRALLALDRFGDTGDWRLGAWLSTILVHVCADIPARRKPTAPLEDWLIETRADERDETTSDHVALAAVKRAIEELPEPQRAAFELRLVDGRPYDEVAGALGITEVNARARVRRARAKLQHALQATNAVKGAWAVVPLVLTSPVRTALRRVFATSAGSSAGSAGSQAVASGVMTSAGSSAASAIAGTPVETGIQLIAQVSTTPLGQAVVASATSVPAKGSVALGILASLATAGGLSVPAISGSTAAPSTSPPAQVASPAVASQVPGVLSSTEPTSGATTSRTFAPQVSKTFVSAPTSAAATSTPGTSAPAAAATTVATTTPSTTTATAGTTTPHAATKTVTAGATSTSGTSVVSTGGGSTTSTSAPASTSRTTPPTWFTTAALAAVYRISTTGASAATTSTPPSGSAGSGDGATTGTASGTPTSSPSGTTSSASGTTSSASGTTSSASGTTSSTSGTTSPTSVPAASITAEQGAPTAGTASTTGTSSTSSTSSTQAAALALPDGTCTGVTGFPGVTEPASVPPLTSDVLSSILSTGSLDLTAGAGSPALEGTALVTPTSAGSESAVHVKVGTCLAEGGSILAVNLTGSTGDEVQLVGSLVGKPSATTTGGDAYLFRGSETQIAGTEEPAGRLPWGLPPSFVAELQVQPTDETGSLTVVFVQPEDETTGTSATAAPAPADGGTSSTPASSLGLSTVEPWSTRPAASVDAD